jgi:hypothetical protein
MFRLTFAALCGREMVVVVDLKAQRGGAPRRGDWSFTMSFRMRMAVRPQSRISSFAVRRTIGTRQHSASGCLCGRSRRVTCSVHQRWYTYGGGAPKPALYGIWAVETMMIDGVERAPLVNDYDRWSRVIVQNTNVLIFERMDGTFISQDLQSGDSSRPAPAAAADAARAV